MPPCNALKTLSFPPKQWVTGVIDWVIDYIEKLIQKNSSLSGLPYKILCTGVNVEKLKQLIVFFSEASNFKYLYEVNV